MIGGYNMYNTIGFTSKKEIYYLDKLLDKYNFTVVEVKKSIDEYIIKSKEQSFSLKKAPKGKRNIINGFIISEELEKHNFHNIVRYIKTNDNNIYVCVKNKAFYCTEFIEGITCDIGKLDEAVEYIKLLANFHLTSKKINNESLFLRNKIKNWHKLFLQYLNDLERLNKIINSMKIKNEFDNIFENNFMEFYERAVLAIKLLGSSKYFKIAKNPNIYKTICADNFNMQNVLKKDDKYYIVNVNKYYINLRIYDLGKIITKLMYNNAFNWDFNKAKLLIEAYNSINKLTEEELEIMLCLIIFPYKFWKIGKRRYVKHKCWNEPQYMEKLKKIISTKAVEKKFINSFMLFLNQYS